MSRQLPLALPPRQAMTRADFCVSQANASALLALEQSASWPDGRLLLVGPEGSGKSHLAQIFVDDENAQLCSAVDLSRTNLPHLAQNGAVVIEDAERIAGDRAAEEALFHLYNLMGERQGLLLITASLPAAQWPLVLADLKSRMQSLGQVTLTAPDDGLLAQVLVKLFSDRQLTVPPALIPYLLARMDRSFAAARDLVTRLDLAALASGGGVTLPLARRVLNDEN